MYSNRISQYFASDELPQAAPAAAAPEAAAPTGFVIVPVAFFAVTQVQGFTPQQPQQPDIYRIAREQAIANARWSAIEKRLFSVWN